MQHGIAGVVVHWNHTRAGLASSKRHVLWEHGTFKHHLDFPRSGEDRRDRSTLARRQQGPVRRLSGKPGDALGLVEPADGQVLILGGDVALLGGDDVGQEPVTSVVIYE